MQRAAVGFAAGVAAAIVALWLAPAEPVVTREATVLTLTGSLGTTNRGPFEPFSDAMFRVHGIAFSSAYAFTLAELRSLPQQTVTAQYPDWPGPVEASGPTLADVLARAEAKGSIVHVQALDGYAVSFERSTVAGSHAILALEADGAPLAIGGRGPTWLVFAPGTVAGHEDDGDAGLVWSVFHIRVD